MCVCMCVSVSVYVCESNIFYTVIPILPSDSALH